MGKPIFSTSKLLFLVVASLPLYVVRFKIFGIPSTLLEVLIVLTGIIWVYHHFRTKDGLKSIYSAFKTPLFIPALLFLSASFLSVLNSTDQLAALGIFRAYFLEPWLLFVIAIDVSLDQKIKLMPALILSGVIIAVPALVQFLTQTAIFPAAAHELRLGRIASFYNSANSVALYLGPLIALILGLFLSKKIKFNSPYYLISLVLFLVVIFLTGSVGALIGLAAVAFYYLFFNLIGDGYKEKLQKLFPVLILSLVTLFFFFLVNISAFTPKTGQVYPRPYDNTRIIRLCLWEGTGELLKNNFLWGSGLNNFPAVYKDFRTCDTELFQYPHNLFLNFWTETGLLGLISWLFLIISFYQMILKSKIEMSVKIALGAYLVYFFVHGLVDVPYFKNDLSTQFWVYLALGTLFVKKAD